MNKVDGVITKVRRVEHKTECDEIYYTWELILEVREVRYPDEVAKTHEDAVNEFTLGEATLTQFTPGTT